MPAGRCGRPQSRDARLAGSTIAPVESESPEWFTASSISEVTPHFRADLTGVDFAPAILACSNRDGVVNEDTIWPDEFAGEDAVEEARWALREPWKRVEQKDSEEEPEDRAA